MAEKDNKRTFELQFPKELGIANTKIVLGHNHVLDAEMDYNKVIKIKEFIRRRNALKASIKIVQNKIFIKPVVEVKYIDLSFKVLPTGSSFEPN